MVKNIEIEMQNKNSNKKKEKKENNKQNKTFIPVSRNIVIDGMVKPPCKINNEINNCKYTFINFIPKILYEQFKYFFNLFFLMVCVSQFIPVFKVGFLFSTLSPLIFVLVLSFIKEGYEDYNKRKRDREINEYKYTKISKGKKIDIKAKDIKVGDVLEIKTNQRIPADCILLYTEEESESLFVRTDQLDGETDWKLKVPISYTQSYYKKNKNFIGKYKIEKAKKEIYEFKSIFKVNNDNFPINLQNSLWSGMVLCNSKAVCLVIYIGEETRMYMNLQKPTQKIGSLDLEINYFAKLLFIFMLIISSILGFFSDSNHFIIIQIIRFILLLSSIIPISLRVSLDFSKLFFSYKISHDDDIKNAQARNSQIPEEWGRVGFILSDKTGTLTQNEMTFKKLKNPYLEFENKNLKEQNIMLKKWIFSKNFNINESSSLSQNNKLKKHSKEYKLQVLKEIAFGISLCHNVTPSYDEVTKEKTFIASSPDEIALVKLAEELGIHIVERDQNSIKLEIIKDKENKIKIEYEILMNFPFTSERKRMGIILKEKNSDKIKFYLKGADTVIQDKIHKVHKGYVLDETENLSREGLRTLVFCEKTLNLEDYKKFEKEYNDLLCDNDPNKPSLYLEKFEKKMNFLCVTAVEDKLQNDVAKVIENLKQANIKIWMLTGDKIETAMCIAISTSLKSLNQNFFVIKDIFDESLIKNELEKLNSISNKSQIVLIIDGNSLSTAKKFNEELFFQLSIQLNCVIISRCSPLQKSYVTGCIKKYDKNKTLAIGDGGNDVGMILEAEIGIGIEGKEGKQAALASDFSLTEFKQLQTLLFWHGRNCYKRTSIMAQFVFHRGLIIAIIQFLFSSLFYYVSIPLFNGFLMLGYATVYTMFPVFSLITDYDLNKENVFNFPILYSSLKKGRELYWKTFLIWFWKSIFQALIIIIFTLLWFETYYEKIATICFTALIFVEFFNIWGEIKNWNKFNITSLALSIIMYILSIYVINDLINIHNINFISFLKSIIISFICYFPFKIFSFFLVKFYPTEEQRLMKTIKLKLPFYFKFLKYITGIFKKKDHTHELEKDLLNF